MHNYKQCQSPFYLFIHYYNGYNPRVSELLKAQPLREAKIPQLQKSCQELIQIGITPSLKVILVGNHPASLIYTRNKKAFIEKIGGLCEIVHLHEEIKEEELINKIEALGNDPSVHGLFVQLPLPKHLAHIDVKQLIPPQKDVDGFHQENMMHILVGDKMEQALQPCTPKGIITLLDHYNISIENKDAVVIGRSMIVGKPMMLMLTNRNATVTLCHSRTQDIAKYTKQADIIISAVGKANFLTKEYFNPAKNQIVIDVGMNHDKNNKLCGDVDFENVKDSVKAITPVPGGVGPMTIFSLAQNLIQAASYVK